MASIGLALAADCRWGFVPLRLGFHSAMFVASVGFFGGIGLSLAATALAGWRLWRSPEYSSWWLLGWCVLLLIFAGVLAL